jgi:predicted acylesterase/phospholipase RssA
MLILATLFGSTGFWRWVGFVLAVLLLSIGVLAATLAGLVGLVSRRVPANYLGLCTGMPGAGSQPETALTPWLHERLQIFAGRAPGASPLTFGDLAERDIELNMMTTNLTRRQPMTMPWSTRQYWFDPDEWRDLFPEEVVGWLEQHPPQVTGGPAAQFRTALLRKQAGKLHPLPAAEDLPIIVATRMSLSFPLLISAVPLYAADFTATANRAASDAATRWRQANPNATVEEALAALPAPEFTPNCFSDGGICSNLPVHFFDRALPTRPTFGIDLTPFPTGRAPSADEAENSYLPAVNQGGTNRRWAPWTPHGLAALTGFGRAIVDTARVWVDEAQLVMPGFRDRVVTIFHDETEGGMNLSMPPDALKRLVDRGAAAAGKLVEQFAGPSPYQTTGKGWDNHRWIRFRTATSGLEAYLADFRGGYSYADPSPIQYASWAGPAANTPQPSYPVVGARGAVLNRRTKALLDIADDWAADPADVFARGAPSPRPVLKLTPGNGPAKLDPHKDAAGDAAGSDRSPR